MAAPITVTLPAATMEVEALERLCADARASASVPQPIEGQTYRFADERNPGGTLGLRRYRGGKWDRKFPDGAWELATIYSWNAEVAEGTLVPYTPPFTAGDWVMRQNGAKGPQKIVEEVCDCRYSLCDANGRYCGNFAASELRPAAPEEIRTATRIIPKGGALLKRKADGNVFAVYFVDADDSSYVYAACVSQPVVKPYVVLRNLSAEHYDILPRYTIEGVS